MSSIVNSGTLRCADKTTHLWYDSQAEAQKLIVRHSCIGGTNTLIPTTKSYGILCLQAGKKEMAKEISMTEKTASSVQEKVSIMVRRLSYV